MSQSSNSEKNNHSKKFLQGAVRHFQQSLDKLPELIHENFEAALQLIEQTRGHIICCGMGKSGLIANKISATLSSTGIPSFFLHPAEALHGDLGAITPHDTLILISYSGETGELISLLPSLKNFGNKSIAFTGRLGSSLDKYADITLPITIDHELCPNNLAPTTSTLLTLATGDLLAVALMEKNGFNRYDFAKFHPGGSLGRKLLMQVKNVMHTPPLPQITPDTLLYDAMLTMTTHRLGMAIAYKDNKLFGIITDGDIRRTLLQDTQALRKPCKRYINPNPSTINENATLSEAEELLISKKISTLVVINDRGDTTGLYEIYFQ